MDENREEEYQMPVTEVDNTSTMSPSNNVADTIKAVGEVDPSRFWMVALVLLAIALSGVIAFTATNFSNELSQKNKEIAELKVELKNCPDETLKRIKREQQALQELKDNVRRDSIKIDSTIRVKSNRLNKLKQIESNL